MGRPRASVSELQLKGTQHSKVVAHMVAEPERIEKRLELEQLFADAKYDYDFARSDVIARGSIITIRRYTSKGVAYEVEGTNPYHRIMKSAASTMASLAKLMGKIPASESSDDKPLPGTCFDIFPELRPERP